MFILQLIVWFLDNVQHWCPSKCDLRDSIGGAFASSLFQAQRKSVVSIKHVGKVISATYANSFAQSFGLQTQQIVSGLWLKQSIQCCSWRLLLLIWLFTFYRLSKIQQTLIERIHKITGALLHLFDPFISCCITSLFIPAYKSSSVIPIEFSGLWLSGVITHLNRHVNPNEGGRFE